MSEVGALVSGLRAHGGSLWTRHLHDGQRVEPPADAPLVAVGVASGVLRVDEGDVPPGGSLLFRGRIEVRATDAVTLLGCGFRDGGRSGRWTAMLPRVAVVPPENDDCAALLDLLVREAERGGPTVVGDRLIDWMLAGTVHAWAAGRSDDRRWRDPVVAVALAALHADPARAWTVASIAAAAGLGRAAFASRFRAVIGVPPLAYLREHRLNLAADLLTDPATTVEAAARRVGYADAFAFSAAFRRERGVPPSALRGLGDRALGRRDRISLDA